jgi:hypothetical protein
MDETFQLRARRLLDKSEPAPLDYAVLSASLSAQQAASAAARAQGRAATPRDESADPLSEILLAGPEWRRAAGAQRGCFNRAESVRRRNDP